LLYSIGLATASFHVEHGPFNVIRQVAPICTAGAHRHHKWFIPGKVSKVNGV